MSAPAPKTDPTPRKNLVGRIVDWALGQWQYFNSGVWDDPRHTTKVAFFKTLNLSMRSFLSSEIQLRAAALTYNTVLAIVPALALVFAICRGFGFQNLLEGQLMDSFPAHHAMVAQGLKFVDSYLNTASEGIFVGAGILFLLWTLFSLMSNVEDAFNNAWGVRQGRTVWRKFTDYMAIFFLLPVLMICSSGINVVMSSTLRTLLPWGFLTPAVGVILDGISLLLIWLFFTGAYMMIPNTRVKFRNAFISGAVAGTAFIVLQWLFLSGQLYVAKYNAIYGSFSFLPLLLIWLQLVWMITLIGAVMCYSMQNIYNIAYIDSVASISIAYREKVSIVVMAIIVAKFRDGDAAPTRTDIAHDYGLPANLLSEVTDRLLSSGLIEALHTESAEVEPGLVPARSIEYFTVENVIATLNNHGAQDFIPDFDKKFAGVVESVDEIYNSIKSLPANVQLATFKIK